MVLTVFKLNVYHSYFLTIIYNFVLSWLTLSCDEQSVSAILTPIVALLISCNVKCWLSARYGGSSIVLCAGCGLKRRFFGLSVSSAWIINFRLFSFTSVLLIFITILCRRRWILNRTYILRCVWITCYVIKSLNLVPTWVHISISLCALMVDSN